MGSGVEDRDRVVLEDLAGNVVHGSNRASHSAGQPWPRRQMMQIERRPIDVGIHRGAALLWAQCRKAGGRRNLEGQVLAQLSDQRLVTFQLGSSHRGQGHPHHPGATGAVFDDRRLVLGVLVSSASADFLH